MIYISLKLNINTVYTDPWYNCILVRSISKHTANTARLIAQFIITENGANKTFHADIFGDADTVSAQKNEKRVAKTLNFLGQLAIVWLIL